MAQEINFAENGPSLFGEEKLNEAAMKIIGQEVAGDEEILAIAGFDRESKVIAVTDRKVLMTHKEQGTVLQALYGNIKEVDRGFCSVCGVVCHPSLRVGA